MLQFIFALIILRWDIGYQAFQWLGDRVLEFLAYTDDGAIFVFGTKFTDHFFAMKVNKLSTVFTFDSTTPVTYTSYINLRKTHFVYIKYTYI